jgi:hypothetical protein
MTVQPANQLTLDFTPGLTERHASLLACARESVYTHRNPLKTIAADMDISQSELSRKLAGNPDDPRRLSVEDFEKLMEATQDFTPIYYLIEKYLTDEDMKQRRALAELARQLPDVLALIKVVGGHKA